MRTPVWIGGIVVGILIVAGCVFKGQSTGERDIKTMRAQQAYLEQQVQSLNDLNDKLTEHSDSLSVQLRQTKAVQKPEESEAEKRLKQLEQTVADLSARYDDLKVGFQKLKQENKTLKNTVARSRNGRQARQVVAQNGNETRVVPASKGRHATKKKDPFQQPAKVAAELQPVRVAAAPSSPTAAMQAPAPPPRVNINFASLSELTSYLGLPKELAERLVNHRPYRIKGELVAKQVLPKETFYQIKDRMTAVQ